MGSRFWLYRTITTTVVRSHTAKHHAHVDCSKSAQHLASPEVCHVCDKNMSKPGVGRDICHKAARQSAERSRGDFHHSCLTYRKHFRSEMPRMILGFTSSFDVGELSTWILSTETSGWLGEFFQYKTTQILGVKDEELQLRLKQPLFLRHYRPVRIVTAASVLLPLSPIVAAVVAMVFSLFLRNYTYYQSISPSVPTTGTSRYYTQY